jgi:predicted ATPase
MAKSYAELGQFDDAWRNIGEARDLVKRTKETWFEVNVHLLAGEVSLRLPQPDTAKAEAYFEQALSIARAQQSRSSELRAVTSMARL